jgi:hypothetical protein
MDKQTSPRRVNLGQLISGNGDQIELKITNETDSDADARRAREAADAKLKRTTSLILFVFAVVAVATVFFTCLVVAVIGSPDDKKWATATVTAVTAGLIGYLVGKK